MIEDQLADRFRAAVTDEPPLGFDPDDVVDQAVRDRKRRLSTMGVSLAVVAVALGAVAMLQVTRSGEVGAGSTETTEPPVSETPSLTVPQTESTGYGFEGFPGIDKAIKQLREVAPQVLNDHVGYSKEGPQDWKGHVNKRCITLFLPWGREGGDMNDGIGVTVCHDRVTGVDERDNNPTAIQNSGPDGSLLRFYRDERGVVVTHVRTDGVLVRVEQNGSQKFNQQDLTELATDGRLTF